MAEIDTSIYIIKFVRTFIALTILIIMLDVKKRIESSLEPEWGVSSRFRFKPRHGIATALSKLYTKIISDDVYSLANTVMVEICTDAAIYFQKPAYFFVHKRNEPKELQKYFKNKELISFLFKPKLWVDRYLMRHHTGYSFRKNRKITDEFIEEMEKLIDIFRDELLRHDPSLKIK